MIGTAHGPESGTNTSGHNNAIVVFVHCMFVFWFSYLFEINTGKQFAKIENLTI